MNDTVHVKMEGSLAEKLFKIDPNQNILSNENEKSVLYVRLNKALYGTLQAAMFFGEHSLQNLLIWVLRSTFMTDVLLKSQ